MSNKDYFEAGLKYAEGTDEAKQQALKMLTHDMPGFVEDIESYMAPVRDWDSSFKEKFENVCALRESLATLDIICNIIEDLCAIELNRKKKDG